MGLLRDTVRDARRPVSTTAPAAPAVRVPGDGPDTGALARGAEEPAPAASPAPTKMQKEGRSSPREVTASPLGGTHGPSLAGPSVPANAAKHDLETGSRRTSASTTERTGETTQPSRYEGPAPSPRRSGSSTVSVVSGQRSSDQATTHEERQLRSDLRRGTRESEAGAEGWPPGHGTPSAFFTGAPPPASPAVNTPSPGRGGGSHPEDAGGTTPPRGGRTDGAPPPAPGPRMAPSTEPRRSASGSARPLDLSSSLPDPAPGTPDLATSPLPARGSPAEQQLALELAAQRTRLAAVAARLDRADRADHLRSSETSAPRAPAPSLSNRSYSGPRVKIGRVDVFVSAPVSAPVSVAAPRSSGGGLASKLYLRRA